MSVVRTILQVLLGLFVAIVAIGLAMPTFNKKPTAFFNSAEKGLSLVEVLDGHPGWYRISFGKPLEKKDESMAMGGRNDCGAIYKTAEGLQLSPPLAAQTQKSTSTLRDLFQSAPQLFPQVFAKCPWAYVTYNTFMFMRGTVGVQVDASGKIILAKEPRYWD